MQLRFKQLRMFPPGEDPEVMTGEQGAHSSAPLLYLSPAGNGEGGRSSLQGWGQRHQHRVGVTVLSGDTGGQRGKTPDLGRPSHSRDTPAGAVVDWDRPQAGSNPLTLSLPFRKSVQDLKSHLTS